MQQAHPCTACLSVLLCRINLNKKCRNMQIRAMWYILCITLCNAVLHQTKKVQAHTPQIDHGLKRWRPIFQQRWQPRWQRCHNFLHWEARPDFKEQTCQTKKQVWQHQRATKFGLPDYSTRSRGRVQRGRLNKGPKWLKASKNSYLGKKSKFRAVRSAAAT